jgi:twitching motility protein PilT
VSLFPTVLTDALSMGASDVHLVAGEKPLYRVHTTLAAVMKWPVLTNDIIEAAVRDFVGLPRFETLQKKRDLDFSMHLEGHGRFRVNAHYQRETLAVAFRAISDHVPALASLNLPPVVEGLANLPRGLVLVTGVTGSGKSTTLASMINAINQLRALHIITMEDPVEYLLRSKKSLIEQREVGGDVPSFASGLRHVLRQDPDVILVGEMRDLETTSAAITAAETGHLVLSTLHTQSAAQTIERIIDIYPGEQQNQIRSMLSNTLQAVITQTLFKRADKPGMIPACEVMICTAAVRNCIRENRIHEIPNIIETSRGAGMCTLDESIRSLCFNGYISQQQALSQAIRPEAMSRAINAA